MPTLVWRERISASEYRLASAGASETRVKVVSKGQTRRGVGRGWTAAPRERFPVAFASGITGKRNGRLLAAVLVYKALDVIAPMHPRYRPVVEEPWDRA
jgi:hypothetical protein